MPPFLQPRIAVSGVKDKIESLTAQGDRIYAGTATGNLHVYSFDESHEGEHPVDLVETRKSLVRKSIDQLGFIKDVNALVVLSESTVTLFPLPTYSPPTPLLKAKSAFSFAIHTSVQHVSPKKTRSDTDLQFGETKIPTLVTQLLIGCRRRAVIYSWRDGEAQDVKEAALPHSARVISFLNQDTVCFAYTPTDYAIFSIPTMTAVEIATPLPVTTSTVAIGALTGLTGYMTLGLGAKAKPALAQIGDSEVLIAKDGEGIPLGPDAKPSRPNTIEWAPPDEIAYVKPYILSLSPPGTVPVVSTETSPTGSTAPQPAFFQSTIIQIRSSLSFALTQTISYPFYASPGNSIAPNVSIRLLTPVPPAKAPVFFTSTPLDRNVAAAEGSALWMVSMKPWAEQLDELVLNAQYTDALALLETVDQALLPDKDKRRKLIRSLHAVSLFRASKFDEAIDTFSELELNPAKVVALYPESVAGRLSISPENWITLYGGPPAVPEEKVLPALGDSGDASGGNKLATDLLDNLSASTSSNTIRDRLRTGLGVLLPSGSKDDDTASISGRSKPAPPDDHHRSIETLLRYLSDRRPKLGAALASVGITPQNQSDRIPALSEASIEDLFELPNAPLSALTPEQLLRYAQIVDTALYKSYLINRPGLLQSLCRVPNWCEVTEVEEDLHARQKYAELRDLYKGKQMHTKALLLLRQLSEKETDAEDKLLPSIEYLQKLGPEHLAEIFNFSRWIFEQDSNQAFEIFTSEDVELPRDKVTEFLESIDIKVAARYLEYLIEERKEETQFYHDRLLQLYLTMILAAKKRNDEEAQRDVYEKLLHFISDDNQFAIDRAYGLMSTTDLFEARAILLGRMGRHDQALELYVYKLQEFHKAEEHCKRVYRSDGETSNVYLTLLRLYLRPTTNTPLNLLPPALELISRHGPRLQPVETLQLLPPLVTASDIKPFLFEALRAPIFDTQVMRQIGKARNDQLARKLMLLQSRRVKVTDSRICPQCHKRIGNSVIAVHIPRGEVTHYQCREIFSRRLKEGTL